MAVLKIERIVMIVRSPCFNLIPTVHCGIIVYNQAEWIRMCIEGMLKQKCDFTFTITIADDCSTDGTVDVLLEYQRCYPEQIQIVLNERNLGIAANWVSCCKAMCGGLYVAFCDGDDYWSNPLKLQMQYDYMIAHPECVALSTDYDLCDTKGNLIKYNVKKDKPPLTGFVQQDLWGKSLANNAWCAFMFNKLIFDKYVPLDAYVEYSFPFQDWPTLVIMSAYGEFHYLPVSTNTVRIGHESDSHYVDFNKFELRMRRAKEMNRYLHHLFPELDFSDEEYDKHINTLLVQLCVKNNEYCIAKKFLHNSYIHGIKYWCCQNYIGFKLLRYAFMCKRFIKTCYAYMNNHVKQTKIY